jgi:hypothetical protein
VWFQKQCHNNKPQICSEFKNNLKLTTMKTKLFNKLCKLAVLVPAFGFAQDANLTFGNLSSYYNTYDNNTKTISGIELVVGADGTNSNNYISSDFETSLYLLSCDNSGTPTSSTPIIIMTYTLTGGTLHQFGTYTWSNQSVDLSTISGLPDGMYRMGAWVNSNASFNGIANPPDDQSDNAGLLESSAGTSSGSVINFTSANAIKTNQAFIASIHNYPNPASSITTIKCKFNSQPESASIKVYNMMGSVVKEINMDKQDKVEFSVTELNEGIYFYSVIADEKILAVNKLVVKH